MKRTLKDELEKVETDFEEAIRKIARNELYRWVDLQIEHGVLKQIVDRLERLERADLT